MHTTWGDISLSSYAAKQNSLHVICRWSVAICQEFHKISHYWCLNRWIFCSSLWWKAMFLCASSRPPLLCVTAALLIAHHHSDWRIDCQCHCSPPSHKIKKGSFYADFDIWSFCYSGQQGHCNIIMSISLTLYGLREKKRWLEWLVVMFALLEDMDKGMNVNSMDIITGYQKVKNPDVSCVHVMKHKHTYSNSRVCTASYLIVITS